MATLTCSIRFPVPVRYMDIQPIAECIPAVWEIYGPHFVHSSEGATGIEFEEHPPLDELKEVITRINGLTDRMPLTWAAAVKSWNQHQLFKEEMYAIPKKGSEGYAEVKEEMAESKKTAEPEKPAESSAIDFAKALLFYKFYYALEKPRGRKVGEAAFLKGAKAFFDNTRRVTGVTSPYEDKISYEMVKDLDEDLLKNKDTLSKQYTDYTAKIRDMGFIVKID